MTASPRDRDRSASVRRWGAGLLATISAAALLSVLSPHPARATEDTTRSASTSSVSSADDALARRYAPRIWLHQDESYFPAAVEPFLANTHLETRADNGNPNQQFLVTNQALGCDSCTNPPFLAGQRPAQTAVPAYAEVVHRTDNGGPTNITDINYWTFFPYNNGKRVCVGWFSRWGCVGGYSTFGNHVGDWEHVTVRFVDDVPYWVSMGQHDGGQTFPYGGPEVDLIGDQPVVYSAQGSHGMYPDARRHTYRDLPNGDTLNDDTGAGTLWDTRQALKVFAWQPVGSYTGEWAWLNYTGRWGNPKSGCFFSEALSGECVLNNGPEGPPRKSLFDPHMQPLDGQPGLQ